MKKAKKMPSKIVFHELSARKYGLLLNSLLANKNNIKKIMGAPTSGTSLRNPRYLAVGGTIEFPRARKRIIR